MAIFLDSNVVLYAFSADQRRAPIAQAIMEAEFDISAQVLNEFINVSRNKLRLDWPDIEQGLKFLRKAARVIHPVDAQTSLVGFALARRYNLAVFDAMIAAAALLAKSDTLYSEDMHNGLIIDGLTIRNPFVVG